MRKDNLKQYYFLHSHNVFVLYLGFEHVIASQLRQLVFTFSFILDVKLEQVGILRRKLCLLNGQV